MKAWTGLIPRRLPVLAGRVLPMLVIAALVIAAWRGWTSAGAQSALETLWALCSPR